jgi:hypothetical protein
MQFYGSDATVSLATSRSRIRASALIDSKGNHHLIQSLRRRCLVHTTMVIQGKCGKKFTWTHANYIQQPLSDSKISRRSMTLYH